MGYQRNSFDYDRVFMTTFIISYKNMLLGKKMSTMGGTTNAFDYENYLKFMAGGNDDTFKSSQDYNISNVNNIYWDYTGQYNIMNVPGNYYTKRLNLYYNNNDYGNF